MSDNFKMGEIVEIQIHHNEKLKNKINKLFKSKRNRERAWRFIHFLKGLHPKINEKLRGKLIHEEIIRD